MRRPFVLLGLVISGLFSLISVRAHAAPSLYIQVDQHGDFTIIGNTLGQECDDSGTTPVPDPAAGTGTVGECGSYLGDSAPDVFWRSEDSSAAADTDIAPDQARSTAMLVLPENAEVTHAFLYWAGYIDIDSADNEVRVERPSVFDTLISSDGSFTSDDTLSENFYYMSLADVTALVQANGAGAYRIGEVDSIDIRDRNDEGPAVGWWMVVFYELESDPPRNLALFHGLDLVDYDIDQNVTLDGFLVPTAGYDAKLGVVTVEGEEGWQGDSLLFNDTVLSDALNPENNFFNGTRSYLGTAVSVAGDFPQLVGTARSVSGLDIDVIDVTSLIEAGDTSATIEATSSIDRYILSVFVTSISTFKPNFESSEKTFVDLNEGALFPGDVIEYTIDIVNSGNDPSLNTVMTDALPEGVTYVPGSIRIASGANEGEKTDESGDDQAEYDDSSRTVTVRLGEGADESQGGRIEIGESTQVVFQVTIDETASGTILNQAIINAGGELGAPPEDYPTDGNGEDPGAPPTQSVLDQCETNDDCGGDTPLCDDTGSPNICVGCITSADCEDPSIPDCNETTQTCECATGPGTCTDRDSDGISDGAEEAIGTDPDDADSDDDGLVDGEELNPSEDTDQDGLINALDPDSDNDGLFDGTELGKNCSNEDTDVSLARCRADRDPGTTTNPLDADTDDGGMSDGSEDWNLNGRLDDDETDPTADHGEDDDDLGDGDGDGLGDDLEDYLGSDPDDADTDDDGALDGEEPNPSQDTDRDGLKNVLDVDSDNDALLDGTEMGYGCNRDGTNRDAGHCRADSDGGETTTSPLNPDTDGGGVIDGSEDANLNGILDSGETDPTVGHGDDDDDVEDSDGDGLGDGLETTIGSDPDDADSDDDGVLDGDEPNPSDDQDQDGDANVIDADSDDDGLFDGTEMGADCDDDATDDSKESCIADGDEGATTTSPLDADTDGGGVNDGDEDTDKDGEVDSGERDPNDPSDDRTGESCEDDSDCGGLYSGSVCTDEGVCEPGCRGEDGNRCPEGKVCTSDDSSIGECVEEEEPSTDAGVEDSGEPDEGLDGGVAEGGIDSGLADGGIDGGPWDGGLLDSSRPDSGSADETDGETDDADGKAVPKKDRSIRGAYVEGGGCGCTLASNNLSKTPIVCSLLAFVICVARSRRRRASP
ncbi:MAG: DUF11 domain-containing protein [Deltaproteobacteria bacterium]|nr:DUF11 domain-containing protein [Deltaproteobacteria bacterium]